MVPRTLQLPSGQSATIRETTEITERQRRPFTRLGALTNNEKLTPDQSADALIDGIYAAVAACIIQWTVSDKPTVDELLDLPIADYDVLQKECLEALTGAAPSFEPSADPESPTTPAPVS